MKTKKKENSCFKQIGPVKFYKVYTETVVGKQMKSGMRH